MHFKTTRTVSSFWILCLVATYDVSYTYRVTRS